MGCDGLVLTLADEVTTFQFTHPVWGATPASLAIAGRLVMFQFTHPVWGATGDAELQILHAVGFNSRTPCGVRQPSVLPTSYLRPFQFTHPVWGATRKAL